MVKVNLFAQNFSPPSSVFGKTPVHVEYVERQMEWDGVTLFEDELINSPVVDQVKSKYKIGWLHEPFCLHPQTYVGALENREKFDCIMTYHDPILSYSEDFVFVPYAGVWIPRDQWGMHAKTKNISMLIGGKQSTRGHQIRHEIADALDKAGLQVDYYGVRGESVDYSWQTKYKVLADYRYSIVTETCMENNLFTEWLLDCFAVGTIPLFWGCPNIGDYFDDAGILSFNEPNELVYYCKRLDETIYGKLCQHARNNLKLLPNYEITEDWIYEHHPKRFYDG